MSLTYFKRYRMEIDLSTRPAVPSLPKDYRLIPWNPSLLSSHAEAKYRSFRGEIDAHVFPCLGEQEGCSRLMFDISQRTGFLPEATWLLSYAPQSGVDQPELCGTVQGIHDPYDFGAIQNLGITPKHRKRGLGSLLLLTALEGFYQVGLRKAYLEVTAQNEGAVQLYARLGFSRVRTVYKASEVAYSYAAE